MRRWRSVLIGFGGLWMAVVLFVGIHQLASAYLGAHSATKVVATATCQGQPTTHVVVIRNDAASPQHTTAKLCDALTFINTDPKLREMAFGEDDHRQAYDGVTEDLLDENQSFTVTLNQAGTFKFHDITHPEVAGDFAVSH